MNATRAERPQPAMLAAQLDAMPLITARELLQSAFSDLQCVASHGVITDSVTARRVASAHKTLGLVLGVNI